MENTALEERKPFLLKRIPQLWDNQFPKSIPLKHPNRYNNPPQSIWYQYLSHGWICTIWYPKVYNQAIFDTSIYKDHGRTSTKNWLTCWVYTCFSEVNEASCYHFPQKQWLAAAGQC
jgi:hypothetical protein